MIRANKTKKGTERQEKGAKAPINTMATQEQINIVAEATAEESKRLLKYCVGIYFADQQGNPVLYGSGFLLRSSEAYYLVTAAHVVDEAIKAGSRKPMGSFRNVIC
jgi:S1-C subfamily serine protease